MINKVSTRNLIYLYCTMLLHKYVKTWELGLCQIHSQTGPFVMIEHKEYTFDDYCYLSIV